MHQRWRQRDHARTSPWPAEHRTWRRSAVSRGSSPWRPPPRTFRARTRARAIGAEPAALATTPSSSMPPCENRDVDNANGDGNVHGVRDHGGCRATSWNPCTQRTSDKATRDRVNPRDKVMVTSLARLPDAQFPQWCMMTHNDAAMTAGRQMERGNPTKPPQQAVVLPRSVPHTLKDGVTRMAHVGNGPPFYRGGRFSADGNFTSYRAMMSSDASVDK